MAQTNFTDDENQKTFIELWCSAEFIIGVDGELLFISALNIFLSISAFLGNTLILVALHKFDNGFLGFYFVCSVFINFDCNKSGQTSRLVAGAQIQTSCNFEKNMYNRFWFLVFVHRCFIYFDTLEYSYTSFV